MLGRSVGNGRKLDTSSHPDIMAGTTLDVSVGSLPLKHALVVAKVYRGCITLLANDSAEETT